MDVYTPDGDTFTQRPLIIFAHGGVFIGGDKNNFMMVDFVRHLLKEVMLPHQFNTD